MSRSQITSTIVDVGAGLKNMYALWLKRYPTMTVHAIEPHPELAQNLRDFIARTIDSAASSRIVVHECAMVDNAMHTATTLHLSNDASSSSTLPFNVDGVRKWKYPIGRRLFKNVGQVQVRCYTLAGWMAQNKISGVDLLNVDVQGNALQVLRGLTESKYWDKIKELVVKVHAVDFDLYTGQSHGPEVLELCQRHYMKLQTHVKLSRGQEDLLTFQSGLLLAKKVPLPNFARKVTRLKT